jgi:uncharacterized protein (TIGR03437 family)
MFKVTSSAGCDWTPVSNATWLAVVSWANVSGSGTVQYRAAFSPLGAPRAGSVTVGGQTFTLTQAAGGPVISKDGVVNAASYAGGALAPGEIVTIFGQGAGPDAPAYLALTDDRTHVTDNLASTRVLFDDVAAPMVFASAQQVSAVVPYDVAGRQSASLKVEYLGVQSGPVTLNVTAVAPGIFTTDGSGKGQGAILNQDYKVNGPGNAAQRGSVVMIFATGEGQTRPAGENGKVAVAPLPAPVAAVTVQIGGQTATLRYAGAAPGMVAGAIQINAQIATNAQVGNAVPVVVRIGNVSTQAGVTMAVR